MKIYWVYKSINYLIRPFYRKVFILEGKLIYYNFYYYPWYKVHDFKYGQNRRNFNAAMTDYYLALRKLQIELYDA